MGLYPAAGAQAGLRADVIDAGRCTSCGACLGLCPYLAAGYDRAVVLDQCDGAEGRCYAFCPRTPTDTKALRSELFEAGDLTPELGAVKDFLLTRAADDEVRSRAQHGGTVTALVRTALEEGIIEAAVLVGCDHGLDPRPRVVTDPAEVVDLAGSKFTASPVLETFNRAASGRAEKIGLVALPCQALALAKMRGKPFPGADDRIDKLKLVIGLFCGWAVNRRPLRGRLEEQFGAEKILGLDIPPSGHHCFEVTTESGVTRIPLDEVLPWVRPSCRDCQDMTAEFADVSVGSARLPSGWDKARGWNQTIVRNQKGLELVELAMRKNRLEFGRMPEGNLEKLKKASRAKRERAEEG